MFKLLDQGTEADLLRCCPAQVAVYVVIRFPQIAKSSYGGLETFRRRAPGIRIYLAVPVIRESVPFPFVCENKHRIVILPPVHKAALKRLPGRPKGFSRRLRASESSLIPKRLQSAVGLVLANHGPGTAGQSLEGVFGEQSL